MDMRFIEVCIGLVLVFALTSLLVTTVTEIWASMRGRRGANLELALRSMLADDPAQGGWRGMLFRHRKPTDFTDALLNHPLLVSQSQGQAHEQGKPSYLPGDLVVSALLDLLGGQENGQSKPRAETPRLMLGALASTKGGDTPPPEGLMRSLETLSKGVETDWQAYERRLVAWFDSIGERSIGWYKRWNQMRLGAFGFLIAVLFNINPIVVASRLWNEEPLRRATVAVAQSTNEAFVASQAASSPDAQAVLRVLERAATRLEAAAPPSEAASATSNGLAGAGTAAAARSDAALGRLRTELHGAQGKDRDSLARIARMLDHETDLRDFVRKRRASVADDTVPEQVLAFSTLVDDEMKRIAELAGQSRLSAVERSAREAQAALAAERVDLLLQALPAASGQRCRAAQTSEARVVCERLEGVRSLGDGGLPVGWNFENLPGCENRGCDPQPDGARSRAEVRDRLKVQIVQLDRGVGQRAAAACTDGKGKDGCDADKAPRSAEAERVEIEARLTSVWRAAASTLQVQPVAMATVIGHCASGKVPCSWSLMLLGWLVVGLASVVGAPFWFDVLGRLIQLRGSGARPADETKGGAAPAAGGGGTTGPGSGMLAPPTQPAGPGSANAGSADALSEAELLLTADDVGRIQRDGLNMKPEEITRRLDTVTRKSIAEWQAQQQLTPAEGVLTGPQIERLLRGTAPAPVQPPAPAAPSGRGATPVRSDGTIAPLKEQEIRDIYGDIATVPGASTGFVKVVADGKPGGPQRVLEPLVVPASMAARFQGLRVHHLARPHLENVLNDIDQAGLSAQILTCDGAVVERHIGRDPVKRLSSHTWGIAIDINAAQNGQGSTPAPKGTHGSVVDLVPFFTKHGFAWGGHFRNGGSDGMHFELALRKP
ncbi:M15 family metallopeptidase [Piscinibacter gummiphilus]|uniref:Uncharacterized protein n=1 Tax=Piscinibacter gummiphilus TaxID=946333 RepID=A0A1W6L6W7_9BURK|nr:M15 family metallopeptidase [Piscinibacter gummiphilus]ARN19946.1 hypothetical protein A4W93_08480 [Piscinibacter gummiphilus]ATU64620.1 hypothetical protein CPZ87_08560 [Piscinibacter gummiphilus]GLS94960.1 hypothetical protein GCM10007918_22520 [Piscinibacter gummiphilus]